MKQEKNLKKVKVVKHWQTGERHYADCGQIDIEFYGPCNCRERMNNFAGWKISDLAYCYMEATAEFYDKRLLARSNKAGYTEYFCNENCKESHFKTY